MKPAFYMLVAVTFYASQNVIIERKLAKISPVANIVFFYIGVLALAGTLVVFRKQWGLNLTMPQNSHVWMLILCGVMLFIADYFLFSAYHSGGSLATVTIVGALFPAIASIIQAVSGGGLPTVRELIAWIFAVIAVVLLSK